jgi:hypothetical protein
LNLSTLLVRGSGERLVIFIHIPRKQSKYSLRRECDADN